MGGAARLIEVRPIGDSDVGWVDALQASTWEGVAVRRGERVELAGLPGFVAWLDGERAGLLTYAIRGDELEIVTLQSLRPGRGVGRALLDAARDAARAAGCRRLWLITGNNNLSALALYQRWGLDLVALHRGAIDESRRRLKPSIPERDPHGVRIAHELELELRL